MSSFPSAHAPSRAAAWLLICAAALSLLLMSHHPRVGGTSMEAALAQIVALSARSAWVHAALIACVLAILVALGEFVHRRRPQGMLDRAGFVLFAIGCIAMIGAALVSGFLVAAVAGRGIGLTAGELAGIGHLLALCHAQNQVLAMLGTIAMSCGIASWSIGLLRDGGSGRWVGVAGLVIGIAPAVALPAGWLHLHVTGMTAVVGLQTLWYVAVGVLMLRGRT
jgi:hypothetical protein